MKRIQTIPGLILILRILLGDALAEEMRVEVDATDLPRGLLHSKMSFSVQPGKQKFWYPKWIPGVHGPVGPIQNLAGLRFKSGSGKSLRWVRDDLLLYQFQVEIPENETELVVELDYICNQPSINSVGIDSYGNSHLGIINWNTCLLYPDTTDVTNLITTVKLRLPREWAHGTALKTKQVQDGLIHFEATDFMTLVDSPLLAGAQFRTIQLTGETQPVFIHLASETSHPLQVEQKYIDQLKEMVRQAERLFGRAPYSSYHFLVAASDQLPTMGLEHLESSLNVVRERDFLEEKIRKQRASYLLPHEYVHSWCGKFRRPKGMITANYHTDKQTQLLWVYEGLAQYLGEMLFVRSGLGTLEDYRQSLAEKLSRLIHITGRAWRPLEDTAVVSHQLRGPSKSWGTLRRGQDYYNEGLLFWLEADALIRTKSREQKTLDDFCRHFFGLNTNGRKVIGFELKDVIDSLNHVHSHDWERLIRARISETHERLPLDVLELLGYRLEYALKPSDFLDQRQKYRKYITALDSIGLEFSEDAKITEIIPGMAGDRAGLAPGMKVEAINNRKFSQDRLRDALSDSVVRRKIDLLVVEGDFYRSFVVEYSDGPKYLHLARKPEAPDLLERILVPKK